MYVYLLNRLAYVKLGLKMSLAVAFVKGLLLVENWVALTEISPHDKL